MRIVSKAVYTARRLIVCIFMVMIGAAIITSSALCDGSLPTAVCDSALLGLLAIFVGFALIVSAVMVDANDEIWKMVHDSLWKQRR